MFQLKVLFFYVVLVVSKTVSALECHRCGIDAPDDCQGESQGEIVPCDQSGAEVTTRVLTHFFPNLSDHVSSNGGYQCIKVTHHFNDENGPNLDIRGCMYDTKKSFCTIENNFLKGNFTCLHCNVDRCNDAAGMKWSIALLMVGWVVTQFAS